MLLENYTFMVAAIISDIMNRENVKSQKFTVQFSNFLGFMRWSIYSN